MPISLSSIAANTATVSFPWGSDNVTIFYYPSRITEKLFASVEMFSNMDMNTLGAAFSSFNETLVHLIKEWDVYEDDEKQVMVPISTERFSDLPIGFRLQALSAIIKDLRPNQIAPQIEN